MSIDYAIIVRNKTRLESLVERFNTISQAKFYIERSGADFTDYVEEHDIFEQSLSQVQRQLSGVVKNKIIDRSFLPSFLFDKKHVVVTIGQDGLVANTAKYIGSIPLIAVNPDKNRYDGILLPFSPSSFINAVQKVIDNKYKSRKVSLAEATLNDGQKLLAFNELFIGVQGHVSARYKISFQDKEEEQSSSGIIISTKAGSTGWMSSLFNMANSLYHFIDKNESRSGNRFILDDEDLFFAVREPFASKKTKTFIVAGTLSGQTTLRLESRMPVNGIIFSDGIEKDFLKFDSGSIVTVRIADEKATLVLPG